MHKSSMNEMRLFRDEYLSGMGASILDIGSRCVMEQKETFKQLFEPNFEYVGMDIEPGENVDIVGYMNIPKIFDVVISGSVMEHVKRPWDWLKSLTNYYKMYICIIAPHTWKEHRFPIDTYRYFPDGMRDLFEYAGIKEVKIKMNKTDTVGIGAK